MFLIDTLQLGEVAGIHHGTYNRERWWWQAAGYTPAGVECWNGIRAIDYLLTRPEVDAEKIAVTGISGGGAATYWITAADERVKVCVPVSGISDLESYVENKVINGHCDCMFLYNTYRWDWTTIAALIAPRPMLFENSGYDTIFPMPANERIRGRLEQIYNWYQPKPGQLFDIGVTPGGHNDNVELRLMAYRWINRHLKGNNDEVSEPPLPAIPGTDLRVFPTDADLPTDSLNAKIDESFVQLANVSPPKSKEEFTAWSKQLRAGLSERVFRPWPDDVPAATVLESMNEWTALETEPGIAVHVVRYPGRDRTSPKQIVDTKQKSDQQSTKASLYLIVVNPREDGNTLPEWASAHLPPGSTALILVLVEQAIICGLAKIRRTMSSEHMSYLVGPWTVVVCGTSKRLPAGCTNKKGEVNDRSSSGQRPGRRARGVRGVARTLHRTGDRR